MAWAKPHVFWLGEGSLLRSWTRRSILQMTYHRHLLSLTPWLYVPAATCLVSRLCAALFLLLVVRRLPAVCLTSCATVCIHGGSLIWPDVILCRLQKQTKWLSFLSRQSKYLSILVDPAIWRIPLLQYCGCWCSEHLKLSWRVVRRGLSIATSACTAPVGASPPVFFYGGLAVPTCASNVALPCAGCVTVRTGLMSS